jgi:signal transduction histidine kinase
MYFLKNMPIRHKLIFIVMLACAVALVSSGAIIIAFQRHHLRNDLIIDHATITEITAANCKAAMAFDDPMDAEDILKTLHVEPTILYACAFTGSNKIFASYTRTGNPDEHKQTNFQLSGHILDKNYLTVFKPIIIEGQTIGGICIKSDLTPMYNKLWRNTYWILSVLLLSMLLTYLLSAKLQKIISDPILDLAKVASVVSENKDYQIRAVKQTNDEIGLLIHAFNEMLEQIQVRDSALVEANTHLEVKVQERTAEMTAEIVERKKAEEAMEKLNKKLETAVKQLTFANTELQEYAHITAHDLKAPLRAIATLANWLATDYADLFDEQGKHQVELMIGRTQRMSNHIDSILKYSEVGRSEGEQTNIDLNSLVNDIISIIAPPEHIEITIQPNLPVIFADKTRIIQLFQNLLTNAIKYNDKSQGKIEISCTDENSFWEFSIADNGVGIEEKHFKKIFKIFQTLAPRDQIESTGIGLSLVKKIVELHHGRIWLQSKPGHGTRFFFTLPKEPRKQNNLKKTEIAAYLAS